MLPVLPIRRSWTQRAPFAGMRAHSKWLPVQKLVDIFSLNGFEADIAERRDERNGQES